MPTNCPRKSTITQWLEASPPIALAFYATLFSFLTYFCMYGLRKPFSVGTFDGSQFLGGEIELKTAIVLSQIFGYTLSKFVGIRVCSETKRHQRAIRIVSLVGCAELALVVFGMVPASWKVAPIFVNGFCLGMIWGFVVSYLEGRNTSEILLAGLSCSYIVSSGVVKDVGRWILSLGISESWMPAMTGIPFLALIIPCAYLLDQLPDPQEIDVSLRGKRIAMKHKDRWEFINRFGFGLAALVVIYFFVTAYRDFRDIYGQEIFTELGYGETPGIFTFTELPIAFGVMLTLSLISAIRQPRMGLLAVIFTQVIGLILMGASTVMMQYQYLSGVAWMILTGLGAYLVYVPFGSVLFERIVASTRFLGTAVFAIYVADAIGYTGSIGLQLYKDLFAAEATRLNFFLQFTYLLCGLGVLLFIVTAVYFDRHSQTTDRVSSREIHESIA